MYEFTAAAEAIVARVADRLTASEASRMESSLEIDLHLGEQHAISRAMRNLESQRLGYRSALSLAEIEELTRISIIAQIGGEPVPTPRDWNDESRAIVATYASDAAPGHALSVENVDHPSYRPYFRTVVAA